MTLAPGGIGGAVVSDNITVEHVLNVKRLAYHLRPAPDIARAHGGRLEGMSPAVSDNDDDSGTSKAPASSDPDAALIEKLVRQILNEMQK